MSNPYPKNVQAEDPQPVQQPAQAILPPPSPGGVVLAVYCLYQDKRYSGGAVETMGGVKKTCNGNTGIWE